MNEETQNNHTNSDQGTSLSPNSESLQTNDARIRNGNFSNNAAYEVSGSSTSNNDVIDTSRTFFAQNTTDDNVTPANYSPPNYISDDGTENDVVPYTPRPPSGPPPAYSPPAGGHGLPIPPPYCEEDVPVSMQIVPTRHHVAVSRNKKYRRLKLLGGLFCSLILIIVVVIIVIISFDTSTTTRSV